MKLLKPKIQQLTNQLPKLAQTHARTLAGHRIKPMREKMWLKQKGYCAACAEAFKMQAMELDHITPLHLGGGDDEVNLQMLCKPCHAAKTGLENTSRARGGEYFQKC